MRKLSILILSIIICFGCSGYNTCIGVGGSWKDAKGELNLCFDPVKSSSVNAPVFTGSDGKEYMGVTKEEASVILKQEIPQAIGAKAISDPFDALAMYLNKK